jgi:hypothetical protein
MIPPKPTGDGPPATWFKWAHESIANLLTFAPRVPGALVSKTTKGIFIKPLPQAGGIPLPPGIEVREMSVCQPEVDDETGETTHVERFVRVLCSVIYDKNDDGDPVDSEGNVLDETTDPPLPDLSGEDQVSGFEITEEGE